MKNNILKTEQQVQKYSNKLVFIPGNVPSLKNSKIKTSRGIFSSKTVKKYLTNFGIQRYSSSKKEIIGYKTRPNIFQDEIVPQILKLLENKEAPYEFGFHFVRGTKHKFDFNNANQLIADLFVAHSVIEDDNMDYFLPYPLKINNKAYTIDKENPGVYVFIN